MIAVTMTRMQAANQGLLAVGASELYSSGAVRQLPRQLPAASNTWNSLHTTS